MPELPEVETIRRELTTQISGRHIQHATVLDPRIVQNLTVRVFEARLRGACITDLERRGKYLLLHLGSNVLVLHLMMSGRLHLRPPTDVRPHTRFVVTLDQDLGLHFVDVRRFGRAWVMNTQKLEVLIGQLGPEPLDVDFNWRCLRDGFRGRQVAVKPALLDQRAVAGIGNIYADEALFAARIHPETPVNRISPKKLKNLTRAIVVALESGISNQGTTFSTFETSRGEPGNNQQHLRVFRRTGEPCVVCNQPIRRIVVSQRGTHYCPRCQQRPRKTRIN